MSSKFFLRPKFERGDLEPSRAGPTGGLVPIIFNAPEESSSKDGQRRSVIQLGMKWHHRRKSVATTVPSKTFSLQMLPGDVEEFPDPWRPSSRMQNPLEHLETSGTDFLTTEKTDRKPGCVAFDLPSPNPTISISRAPSGRARSSTAPSLYDAVIELPGSLLQDNEGYPEGQTPPPSPLRPKPSVRGRAHSDHRVDRAHVFSMLFPPETTAGPVEPDLRLSKPELSPKSPKDTTEDIKDLRTALLAQKATIHSLNTKVGEIQSTHDAKVAKLDEKHAEELAELKAYTSELERRVSVYRLSEIIESPTFEGSFTGPSPEPQDSSFELFPEKDNLRRVHSDPGKPKDAAELRQEKDQLRKELDQVTIRHKVAMQYLQEAKDREDMLQETVEGLRMRLADTTEDHHALAEEKKGLLQEQRTLKKKVDVLNKHKLTCDAEDVRAIAKMAEERAAMLEAQLRAGPNAQVVKDNEEVSEMMASFLKQIDDLNIVVKQGKQQILRLEEENELCRIDVENAEHRYEQLVKHTNKAKPQEEAQSALKHELKGKNVIIAKQNTQLLEQYTLITDLKTKVSQLQESVHKSKKDSSDFYRLLQLEIRNRAGQAHEHADTTFPPTPEAEFPPDMDRNFEVLKAELHARMARVTGIEYEKASKHLDSKSRVKYLEREVDYLLRDLVAMRRDAVDPTRKPRKQSSKSNLRETLFQEFHNPFSGTSTGLARKASTRMEKKPSHEGRQHPSAAAGRTSSVPTTAITAKGSSRTNSEPANNVPSKSRASPTPHSRTSPVPPSRTSPVPPSREGPTASARNTPSPSRNTPPPSHSPPAPPVTTKKLSTTTSNPPVSAEKKVAIAAPHRHHQRQETAPAQVPPTSQPMERKKSLPQLQKRLPPTPDARDPTLSRKRSLRQQLNRPQRPLITPINIGLPSPKQLPQPIVLMEATTSAPGTTRAPKPRETIVNANTISAEMAKRISANAESLAAARAPKMERMRSKHEHTRSRSMNTLTVQQVKDRHSNSADSNPMEAILSPVKVVLV